MAGSLAIAGDDAATAPPPSGPVHQLVLKDLDGNDVPLAKYAGKPMIIEIWATWCGPCRKQRALMTKLAPEFKDKVVFIAASVDQNGAPTVKAYLQGKPVCEQLVELIASPELRALIAKREPANTIPKVVYIDSRGSIKDVSASVQTETWMRAMLKNLR